jgi:hypothetical protein
MHNFAASQVFVFVGGFEDFFTNFSAVFEKFCAMWLRKLDQHPFHRSAEKNFMTLLSVRAVVLDGQWPSAPSHWQRDEI